MYLLAAGWRWDERHGAIGNSGLIKNICATMQNICRLLAAGERNAHPIEAMSSVVALFFVSVLFFLSLELCKWMRVRYDPVLLCICVGFVVCKQSLWFVGSTCGWLSNGQFLMTFRKNYSEPIKERSDREPRGESRSSVCVFLCLWWHSPKVLCRYVFLVI